MMVYHRIIVYRYEKITKNQKNTKNKCLIPGVLGRVFGGPDAEKLDFIEIGVAGPAPDPEPRKERQRRAGSVLPFESQFFY